MNAKVSLSLLLVFAGASAIGQERNAQTPLRLEWPEWFEVPGGRLVSKVTNAPGKIVAGDTCPGDVLGKASIGCIRREYQSTVPMANLYKYFGDLLRQNGFMVVNPSTAQYPNQPDGNFLVDPFARVKMRQFPVPGDRNTYREFIILLRQPNTPTTRVEISYMVGNGRAAVGTPATSTTSIAPLVTSAQHELLKTWEGLPAPQPKSRDEWQWVIQSVAQKKDGGGIKYTNHYSEQATGKTLSARLPLPNGGVIVHVFPETAFYIEDDQGNRTRFASAREAIGKAVGPGNWTVYPGKVNGVVVYFADPGRYARQHQAKAADASTITPPPADAPVAAERKPVNMAEIKVGMELAEIVGRYGEPTMRLTDEENSQLVERLIYQTTAGQVEVRFVKHKVTEVRTR